MDFICVCVRIPKCGSTSLTNSLKRAFAGRGIFYLPHTLNLEGNLSPFQRLRFYRSQTRNLFPHYLTSSIATAYEIIDRKALEGDLISGGHIDFASVRDNIGRPLKMITLFRNPVERCRSEYEYCRRTYSSKPYLSRFDASIKHQMAASYDFHGYVDFLLEHAETYGNLAARYVGWDGREALDGYFARHVFHSGVLENSDAFVRGLVDKMGIPPLFPHDNKSMPRTTAIGTVERAKIERLYPRDFELYGWQLAELEKAQKRATPQVNVGLPARSQAMTRFGCVT